MSGKASSLIIDNDCSLPTESSCEIRPHTNTTIDTDDRVAGPRQLLCPGSHNKAPQSEASI